MNTSTEALIAHMKLEIEKLRRALYGHRSERKARLLEQMELQLEELEAAATEDELAAEKAAAKTQTICSDAPPRPFADAAQTDDRIEIELGNGRLVRVGSGIDMGALRRILAVLDGR